MMGLNLKPSLNRNLIILHATVFIWGFTGILGKLISVSAVSLVWYRVIIAACSLLLYFLITKRSFAVNRATFFKLVFTGALVGAHWITFFASIKLSTVSVTLVCLSSITLFTAVFEPLINRKPISKLQLLAGLLIITGIAIIFKFEVTYTKGILAGLVSAALAGLFPVINSKFVKNLNAPVIAFYELSGAFVWISAFLFLTRGFTKQIIPTTADIGYLLVLGTVCTSLAYVAGVSVMRELSAFRVALITNLEPVYGIVMAFIFFGDINKMTTGFWVGALIILSTILLFPFTQKHIERRRSGKSVS